MRLLDNKFTYLSLTLLSKILINLVVVFYVAKQVSLEIFGDFILAFSYATVFTMLFDYGFNLQSLIINPNGAGVGKQINAMVGGKLFIVLVFIPIVWIGILFSGATPSFKIILVLLLISAIFSSFGNFYLNFFKTIDKYHKETIGYMVQVLVLFVGLITLRFIDSKSIFHFCSVILVSRLIYVIIKQFFNI